jgi:dipeptidyl aminopeptidase/acylaminoacyl peptidase
MKRITALFGLFLLPLSALAQQPSKDRPIVFAARLTGQKYSQIYRINTDGTGRIPLTKAPADATYPRWSPDGKWIVFTDGYDQSKGRRYVIDPEGKTKPRRVTDAAEFDWVRDLEDPPAPGGKHALGDTSIIDLKTDKETPLEEVTLETPMVWLDSKRVVSVKNSEKNGARLEQTTLRLHGLDGKITASFAPTPSEEDTKRFDEEASYGSVWLLHRIPLTDKLVLARLGGGNKEGKWPIGLLVDTKTQTVTWWGEFGYSGMFFSSDGKRFLTALNRKNPKTQKLENTLYIGATDNPQKLTPLVKALDLIVGDWRGGMASQ